MCTLHQVELLLCSEGNNELGYTCSFLVDYCIIYSHTQNAREKIWKETQAPDNNTKFQSSPNGAECHCCGGGDSGDGDGSKQ